MKIDGIDIRKFNAKQLTVDIQPPKIAVENEWIDGAPVPLEFETFIKAGTLKLSILFRGDSRSQIVHNVSNFMALLTHGVVMQLDGYKGYYTGKLTDDSLSKTIVKTRYTVNLTFAGYMIDDEIKNTYIDKDTAQFDVLGTRDAPCIVEITPTVDMSEYRIDGFGDDPIIIKNLEAGKKIIIDGAAGTATQDGVNKFADVDLWDFPKLTHGQKYVLNFSSNKCVVVMRYNPMWI